MTDRQASTAGFVGRADQLAALQQALANAVAGHGSIALVAGEPGIGKTRLAEEVAAGAAAMGARVLWGRCYEGEGAPAFWPWIQVLRAAAVGRDASALRSALGTDTAYLAALMPELHDESTTGVPAPTESPEERFRLFAAASAFLTTTASTTPLLVILDDMHWADTPSLLLFEFLVREAGTARLLLVGMYRDVEVGEARPLSRTLGRLGHQSHGLWLEVRGLTKAEVETVFAGIVGNPVTPALVTAVSEATEGNPLFIGEIARAHAAGVRSAANAPFTIPPTVRAMIGLRLNELSPACSHLLTLAAVIGREFPLRALQQASEDAGQQVLLVLEQAEVAKLAAPAGRPGTFRFAHALIRETLYNAIPGPRRARLHHQIGEALEQLWGNDPEHLAELTRHFLQAGAAYDAQKALAYARRTAEHAWTLLAYEESARYDEMALQALEWSAPADRRQRFDLLLRVAKAHNAAGEYIAGQDAVRRAVDLARQFGEPAALVRAVLAYEHRVDLGTADAEWIAFLEEAWRVVPEDPAPRARLGATLSRALTFVDAERSARLGREAVDVARRAADPATLAFALTYHLMAEAGPDEAGNRLPLASEIVALAEQIGDTDLQLQGHDRRALALVARGEIAAASAEIAAMCRIGEQQRYPHVEWRRRAWSAMCAVLEGRFADAEAGMAAARAAGERSGMPGAAQHFAIQLFALRREQGRLSELTDAVTGMVAQFCLPVWRAALAQAYVDLDRIDDARREFERLAVRDFADVPLDMLWLPTLVVLAYICNALGDRRRAAMLYELVLPHRERQVAVTMAASACNGCASRELGLLAATLGRWEDAAGHFTDALRMNDAMGARPLVARTRYEYARMLLQQSDAQRFAGSPLVIELRERVRDLLGESRAMAEAVGMSRLVAQIDRVQPAPVAGPGRAPSTGSAPQPPPHGITVRELDVLRLLAAGYSNKQIAGTLFLSVATVHGHTISIYAKIGATGRAAAAAYALRHGIVPPSSS